MNSFLADVSPTGGNREKIGILVGLTGILTNGFVFALELFSDISTGSTTVTADAFHNSVDAVSSVATLVTFFIVKRPADRKHPFGFGRVEYLGSLFMGLVILGIGLFFLGSSFEKMLHPSPVRFSAVALIFMSLSIVLKLLYSLFNHKYARMIASQTLTAASLDAWGDVLVLVVATFSLVFTKLTGIPVDGPLGLAVSGFILFSGYSVLKRAAASLIGKAPDPAITQTITSVMRKAKYMTGIHDLMVHDYGPEKVIASIHAEISSDVPLVKAHQAMAQAQEELEKYGVELVIHIDPVVARANPPAAPSVPGVHMATLPLK